MIPWKNQYPHSRMSRSVHKAWSGQRHRQKLVGARQDQAHRLAASSHQHLGSRVWNVSEFPGGGQDALPGSGRKEFPGDCLRRAIRWSGGLRLRGRYQGSDSATSYRNQCEEIHHFAWPRRNRTLLTTGLANYRN